MSAIPRDQPPVPDAGPLLDVRGLTVDLVNPRGAAVRVVEDVDLRLMPGETLGLVGESGCGKTMSALALMGLAPGARVSGRAVFEGRDLIGMAPGELARVRGARIGFVFQHPGAALSPVHRIGEQLRETLLVHGAVTRAEADRRAIALLREAAVPDPERRAAAYPHQLSGGLQQRAMIALALACGPSLLIADEPTTALDATLQADILDLLRALATRNRLAVLLISHDLGVVAHGAHRVAVMYAGRIVEQAGVHEIFSRPSHPYTRALLASLPGAPDVPLRAIPGAVPDPGRWPPGCAFAPRCPHAVPACGEAVPRLRSIGDGRELRCVHVDGVPAAAGADRSRQP